MQTLILSCNTGAGHNSCAQAVQEAYHSRGEICNITDSLQFISEKASTFISNWHTRIYRHAPRLFDAGYQRAESHEDIFCEGTPIYKLLSSGAERMYQYIRSAGYDNIICTHVFPALALTEMRRQHPCLQLVTSHISTDYTCAPCTADSALDWYFIPSTSLLGEFEQCGLQPQKLIASGIPVRQQFYQRVSQEAGKANAGISPAHQHILIVYQATQFVENQFIYPHVVGNSVGLSPFWTLLAVLLGGKLFGVLGMIFFIPLMALVSQLLHESIERRLHTRKPELSNVQSNSDENTDISQ
jgi:processive 1,2-diacylglycerol beta-glucosyltransferase